MNDDRRLRTAIQAIGVYFLCQGVASLLGVVLRSILPVLMREQTISGQTLRLPFIENLMFALPPVFIGWILLAKTTWCERTVEKLSRPPKDADSGGDILAK